MYLYRLNEATLNNQMKIKPENPTHFELKNSALLRMCKSSDCGIIFTHLAKFTNHVVEIEVILNTIYCISSYQDT